MMIIIFMWDEYTYKQMAIARPGAKKYPQNATLTKTPLATCGGHLAPLVTEDK
jgi:hypothetical protein